MKQEELIYDPAVGLTIQQAFEEAIAIAKKHGKPVTANINDIVMKVTSKTKAMNAVALFQKKLQAQYEAECRTYERRKKCEENRKKYRQRKKTKRSIKKQGHER